MGIGSPAYISIYRKQGEELLLRAEQMKNLDGGEEGGEECHVVGLE